MNISTANEDPHELHERIVPFLGSAVSMFHPTSLPNWNDFIRGINRALQIASKSDDTSGEINGSPQQFTETVSRRLGQRYLGVMQGLLKRQPNNVHKYLVENIKKGKYPAIVTTNFDRVIEDLLTSENVPWCELRGRNMDKDRANLDKLVDNSKGDQVKVVVVTDPRAFLGLEKMSGILGRPDMCFFLKIHGDAAYPETCVDNELQRERGLPSAVRAALSLLLKRFPFFFIGWGGGDLDHNVDYVRLRSEADRARIYWLLPETFSDPPVFEMLRKLYSDSANRQAESESEYPSPFFKVVRGGLDGEFQKSGEAFNNATELWAKGIGKEWSALALGDLTRDPPNTVAEARNRLKLVPKAATSSFAGQSVKLASLCIDAIEAIKNSELDKAWKSCRAAILIARKLNGGTLTFADAWVPFAIGACVCSMKGAAELAFDLFLDALSTARRAGNKAAAEYLNDAELPKLIRESHELLDASHTKAAHSIADQQDDAVEENPLQVFSLGFDNVTNSSTSGLPEDTLMRGELLRCILVGDVVILPQQSIVNSRILVKEVLFDEAGAMNEDLVSRVRPLLYSTVSDSTTPLVDIRRHLVNQEYFMHEEIPMSYIEQMQQVYLNKNIAPLHAEMKPLAARYTSRTLAVAKSRATPLTVLGSKTAVKLSNASQTLEAMAKYADAVSNAGQGMLTRSDLYRWGDMFPDKPTSDEELWNATKPEAREVWQNNSQELFDERHEALRRPWWSSELVKQVADAPYTTNLPLGEQLSIVLAHADSEMRPLTVVREAIASEDHPSASVAPFAFANIKVEAESLSNFPISDVIELRNSVQGKAFRRAARQYRDRGDEESRQLAEAASVAYSNLLQKAMANPSKRELPMKLNEIAEKKYQTGADEDLLSYMISSLVPAMSPPPPSLYDVELVSFPGLLVVGKPEVKFEKYTKAKKRLSFRRSIRRSVGPTHESSGSNCAVQ